MIDVRASFPGAEEHTYLNTASIAVGNTAAAEAIRNAIERWEHGDFSWVEAEQVGEQLRDLVAGLIGASSDDIAFVAGASGGAGTIAAQLPPGETGSNVVVPAEDFASNFLPWKQLETKNYQLRPVAAQDDEFPLDAFAELVDEKTTVIATSLVQSASGYRVDLDGLKTLATEAGAWLVLDVSQALGAMTIDLEGIDAMFSCSHKWVLGIRGIGHLYVRPGLREEFEPITAGWKAVADPVNRFYGPDLELSETASKLDSSWPWLNPYSDIEGLRILHAATVERVEDHNLDLVSRLEDLMGPLRFDGANRSQIVSLDVDNALAATESLRSAGIVASPRASRVRVSFHLYNNAQDVDRLAKALRS